MKQQVILNFFYERRFFFGSFLFVLFLGFIFDWRTKLDAFYTELEQEKNLSLQLEEKEQALKQAGPIAERLHHLQAEKMKKPLLDQMIQAAKISGCTLIDLQTRVKNAEKTGSGMQILIKMNLLSDYAGFHHWFALLLRQGLPLQVDHFSLSIQDDQLLMIVQFTAFPTAFWTADPAPTQPSEAQPPCCGRDPFQDSSDASLEAILDPEPFGTFAWKELRYIAYLALNGRQSALLLLPNGHTQEVKPGSYVGKKAWQVLSMNSKFLTLAHSSEQIRLSLKRIDS